VGAGEAGSNRASGVGPKAEKERSWNSFLSRGKQTRDRSTARQSLIRTDLTEGTHVQPPDSEKARPPPEIVAEEKEVARSKSLAEL